MTCAKCGMSIDAHGGERQEAVRGRVKEKPEVEIDPSLPQTPSTFPLIPALVGFTLVLGGIVGAIAYVRSRPSEISATQRENLQAVKQMQEAFQTLWESMPQVHDSIACVHLQEVVARPCKPTVDVSLLAIDQAVLAIAQPGSPFACVNAVTAYLESRVAAKCD